MPGTLPETDRPGGGPGRRCRAEPDRHGQV